MAQLHIDGPIDISDELAMAMFKSLPDIGQAGVAQMFAARLMAGPLGEKAVESAARVYMERCEVGEAGAKALRESVAARCRALGEKQINEEAVRGIVQDEVRKAAVELARQRADSVFEGLRLDALTSAVAPAVQSAVGALANKYFLQTQNGQRAIMDLIEGVLADSRAAMTAEVNGKLTTAVHPRLSQSVGDLPIAQPPPKTRRARRSRRKPLDDGKDKDIT